MNQPATRPRKRPRRLARRIVAFVGYSVAAVGLAWFFESQATTTVIFVRHADTDTSMATATAEDAPINARGRARAEMLAEFLAKVDVVASVNAIYASAARRTQQTAEPLAKRLGLEVEIDDPYEVERFMREVLREHKGEIVLIVSHSDAIAPLIDELHGSKRLEPIASDDYDNIYIVTIPWFGKVKTLQLEYGAPSPAGVELSERTAAELADPR